MAGIWTTRAAGFLKVRVRAAPIEGRANEALIAFLAKIPETAEITVVHWWPAIPRASSRSRLTGWSEAELAALIP